LAGEGDLVFAQVPRLAKEHIFLVVVVEVGVNVDLVDKRALSWRVASHPLSLFDEHGAIERVDPRGQIREGL
jgi:hypothetical protein